MYVRPFSPDCLFSPTQIWVPCRYPSRHHPISCVVLPADKAPFHHSLERSANHYSYQRAYIQKISHPWRFRPVKFTWHPNYLSIYTENKNYILFLHFKINSAPNFTLPSFPSQSALGSFLVRVFTESRVENKYIENEGVGKVRPAKGKCVECREKRQK